MSDEVKPAIAHTTAIVLSMRKQWLSDEEQAHLRQIIAWCQASPLLWEIIARIGWDLSEGCERELSFISKQR